MLVDLVHLECKRCKLVRTFDMTSAPIVGVPAAVEWLDDVDMCPCGHDRAHVKLRIAAEN